MALQLALIEKVNTDGPDVFLISTKGLGDVSNRAVAVLFDMAQDLVCKPLPNSWQLLFLVVNQPPVKGFSLPLLCSCKTRVWGTFPPVDWKPQQRQRSMRRPAV